MRKQTAFRIAAALLGTVLLGYLITRIGTVALMDSLHRLGWGILLIFALGGIAHVVKAAAWRLTLSGSSNRVSFSRLFQLRLISEAIGQAGALAQFFGEGLRISALSKEIPIDERMSSVALDRALFVVTGALISFGGLAAALVIVPLSAALHLYAALFALGIAGLMCSVVVAVIRRWRLLSGSALVCSRLPYAGRRIKSALPLIRAVEGRLLEFNRTSPFAFWTSLVLNLVCHGLAILEVYLTLLLLGAKIPILGALVYEALTKLVNAAGSLTPGNIGTYEGGNMLIGRVFALPVSIGLAVAVTRRARAIFWTAAGAACFLFLSKARSGPGSENGMENLPRHSSDREALPQTSRPLTALVLANRIRSPLFRLGGIPILLRNILSVRRAGAGRVVVLLDSASGPEVWNEIYRVRSPLSDVSRHEVPGQVNLCDLVQELCEEPGGRILLVDGRHSYCPALFRQACEWASQDKALSLTAGGQPIGLDLLPGILFRDKAAPGDVYTLEDLQEWLTSSSDVQREEVDAESWHQVLTEEDRPSAERKLDRWLVKPTDGVFARFNRRISVPISRQLINLPVTPNMVSLFTLCIGFAAGLLFARGGYWNTLAGAVFSVWASILDGCDGEVARLKLMETDFGCWLETVCDWMYYLFIFAGMAIGLAKTLAPATYFTWGAMLLFGAAMSFVVTGLGRRRFANRQPEQYLAIWQTNAEKRRANPILYFGRNMEFVIRRCFMPYALLVFALLNLIKVAFFLSALGANLVWAISLYSYLTFALGSKSNPPLSPEPAAFSTAE